MKGRLLGTSVVLGMGLLLSGSCTPTPAPSMAIDSTPASPHRVCFFEGSARQAEALVYAFRLDTATLDLFNGQKRTFAQLARSSGREYHLLMNAGMFHANGEPVGLLVNRDTTYPLNEDSGRRGNFFLQPNGVFFVDQAGRAGIQPTAVFKQQTLHQRPLQLATQSGPLLLIDGAYHPAFNRDSPNRNLRNGVGITPDQTIVFILSTQPVTFHTFASMFLDRGCEQALYLDGAISGLYIRGEGSPLGAFEQRYGPVLGLRE